MNRHVRNDLLAWLALAGATLIILWPLGLTNRILAGIDAFTYFTPYWDYRMAAFRAGELPLWNPYLFTGTPFLANPQAAVLYPLHWPFNGLSAPQALVWSALLHCWLAAGLTYIWAQRSFRLSRPAAFLAGLIFGLSGFTLARVENINQLNGLAWLPALLWLHDETSRATTSRSRLRGLVALTCVIALQLLAGHTQTTFINLVAWALYAVVQGMTIARTRRAAPIAVAGDLGTRLRPFLPALTPFVALIPAVLLSAAQLLPTLELNGLGLRSGGLSYRETVSFSLGPRLLLQSLLPPYGGGLAEAFGNEGFAEFMGYVGLTGLGLAVLGAWRGARRGIAPGVLAGAGFFLALGAFNPFYYLLWRVVPGFALFRAPARWLALFALGLAILAGLGLDVLGQVSRPQWRRPRRPATRLGLLAVAVVAAGLLAWQQWPQWPIFVGWAAGAVLVAVLIGWAFRRPTFAPAARAGLIGLLLVEFFIAGRHLPYAAATAPAALALRNAPAALLAATASQPPAGRDRFLSLSDIRYDPGDLADLRSLQADRLAPPAIERLVRAAKQVEVLTPNLPLVYRLPAVDGYDGGLLPLQRYVKLQRLFLPTGEPAPDGRLRQQLADIPAERLLDLTDVRFVITDKQRDLWAGDVYYDLEQAVTLQRGEILALDLQDTPHFIASAVGLVAEAPGAKPADLVGELILDLQDGRTITETLRAGQEVARDATAPPTPQVLTWVAPDGAEQKVDRLTIRNTGDIAVVVRGVSLLNPATGAHTSVTLSRRGDLRRIHSGDVKIYERTAAPGRAWLVHGMLRVQDDTIFARLADEAFDPRSTVLVEAETSEQAPGAMLAGEAVRVLAYEAQRVQLHAQVLAPGLLVLADAWYPGWQVTVDGRGAPLLRANGMFRGVALAQGSHTVEFTFAPASWRQGLIVSLITLACLAFMVLRTFVSSTRRK